MSYKGCIRRKKKIKKGLAYFPYLGIIPPDEQEKA